jgi:hypothetical protein
VNVKAVVNRFAIMLALFWAASAMPEIASAQDWIHTGTGLGVAKPRVAAADFGPRADAAKNHSELFTQVVRDDLSYSGILEVVSPSFYPSPQPIRPPTPTWLLSET